MASGSTTCAICNEEFQDGEIVTSFRHWPGEEQQGHIDCLISLIADDEEDDED
ncbi:MAG TPA: hypothetical protein VHU23_08635 [Rhizomicrobium sp.]|jgi:hypothetical protein|nr:hypothetical protein [Rhizomicrobium sp.]